MTQAIKLTDYDVIGFDLDNTLLLYNLSKIFPLQYDFLSNYMVEHKSYSRSVFHKKLTVEDADFFLRGLFLDFSRGNILHLRNDGFIIKATHGTSLLSDIDIENIYGVSRIWSTVSLFIDNKLSLWDLTGTRAFFDFTDSIVPLIFAKAVDSVDSDNTVSEYVWADVLEAVVHMYMPGSTYLQTIGSNLSDFFHPCEDVVISWLKTLKKRSKLLLITGAEAEMAKISIPYCFDGKHFELFDIIICDAKKPGFFNKQKPFQNLNGEKTEILLNSNFYRNGNWSDIYKYLRNVFDRDIKCVYIGDNPLQDIYAPSKMKNNIDTIGIVEELFSEKGPRSNASDHPHSLYVASKFWGPCLSSPSGVYTMMGSIFKESAKLVVPSVKYLATKPIDYEFQEYIEHTF